MTKEIQMKSAGAKTVALALTAVLLGGCQAMQTDTGKGAAIGGGTGALIGGLLDHSNPLAGILIGAAGGALVGGTVGHFMDQRKQDLEKTLQPEINAGQASVTELPGNALEELKGTGGKVLRTSLSHDDEEKLQAALSAAKS
jgi:uncharacterized membrane protein